MATEKQPLFNEVERDIIKTALNFYEAAQKRQAGNVRTPKPVQELHRQELQRIQALRIKLD